MRGHKLIGMLAILIITGCSGGNPDRASREAVTGLLPDSAGEREAGRTGTGEDKSFIPEPVLPAAPAPEGTGEGGGKVGLAPGALKPSGVLASAAFRDDLILPKGMESEEVHKKACQSKYDQCMAKTSGSDYAVEAQRACATNHTNCLAEPTEEMKCEGSYKTCMGSTAGSEYAVEAQRSCASAREQCIASNVYPDCCDNSYSTCMKAIPASAYSIELERGCAKQQEQCKARFYCE